MSRNTNTTMALVCVATIAAVLLIMSPSLVTAADFLNNNWGATLDIGGIKSVAQLEALYPKWSGTTTYNTTTTTTCVNATTLTNCTQTNSTTSNTKWGAPIMYCDDLVMTQLNSTIKEGGCPYSIRTSYPPICVMWYGQLRNPIYNNYTGTTSAAGSGDTVLFDPNDGTSGGIHNPPLTLPLILMTSNVCMYVCMYVCMCVLDGS
jgi:hypothetical protein